AERGHGAVVPGAPGPAVRQPARTEFGGGDAEQRRRAGRRPGTAGGGAGGTVVRAELGAGRPGAGTGGRAAGPGPGEAGGEVGGGRAGVKSPLVAESSYPNFAGKHAGEALFTAADFLAYLRRAGARDAGPRPPGLLLGYQPALGDHVLTPEGCGPSRP